jgi:nucleoid DNA-binding protein
MSMPKKTKTLKKPKTIQVKKPLLIQPTQAELKKAYQLVTQDLFTKLVKAKDQEKITIGAMGSLGSFFKKERKVKSGIHPKGFKGKPKLNTYVYYSLRFKPARKLKEELSRILDKKYNK